MLLFCLINHEVRARPGLFFVRNIVNIKEVNTRIMTL